MPRPRRCLPAGSADACSSWLGSPRGSCSSSTPLASFETCRHFPAIDWKRWRAIGADSTVSGSTISTASALSGRTATRRTWRSSTITSVRGATMAKSRRLPPVHPGEILREDLMAPLGLSINKVARDLRVPVTRMSEIVNGRRSITADTALRLARYFAMTPQFWMNLQAAYDLDLATRASADRIKRDVHPREAA